MNLLKGTVLDMKRWAVQGVEADLCLFGKKGIQFFRNYGGNVLAATQDISEAPAVEDLVGSIKVMLDAFDAGKVDKIFLSNNVFVNTMTQTPTIEQLVPLDPSQDEGLAPRWDYIYEPDARQLIASARRDVRIAIDASAVPTNAGRSWKQALSDGEDYELLFTASKPPPEMVCGVPITVIGYVAEALDQTPPVVAIDSGMEIDVESFGWEHRS